MCSTNMKIPKYVYECSLLANRFNLALGNQSITERKNTVSHKSLNKKLTLAFLPFFVSLVLHSMI